MQDLQGGIILDGIGMDANQLKQNIRSSLLVNPLKDLFRCIICRSIVTPPTVISLCCKQILGCKACFGQLQNQQQNQQRCPHCRDENSPSIELGIFDVILTVLEDLITE